MANDIKSRMEPGILDTQAGYAASLAVSAKRIADGLDQLLDFWRQHSWEGSIQVRDTGKRDR